MSDAETPPQIEPIITDPDLLYASMLHSLSFKMSAKGEVVMPCVPSMIDHYMKWLERLFLMLGRPMPAEVQEGLRKVLAQHLQDGFQASRYSEVVFRYEPSDKSHFGVACTIGTRASSIADEYSKWVETRDPPFFGPQPDAKVMAVAAQVGNSAPVRILDVGAGTGRNALPLARLGHAVDAVEVTAVFAEQLRTAAAAEQLPITVIEGDVLDAQVQMRSQAYQLVLVSEVLSDFRTVDQLRKFFHRMCDLLSPDGWFLFNIFLAVEGYEPNQVAREVSQVVISSIFTPAELTTALEGLPLEILSNESVCEYEQTHLPPGAWPPISWFENWATGRNVFALEEGQPPMELRWILCRRRL